MDYMLCPRCNSSRLQDDKDGYRYVRYTCGACELAFDEPDGVHVQHWLWTLVHAMETDSVAYMQVAKPSMGGPLGDGNYYPGHLISGTGV